MEKVDITFAVSVKFELFSGRFRRRSLRLRTAILFVSFVTERKLYLDFILDII